MTQTAKSHQQTHEDIALRYYRNAGYNNGQVRSGMIDAAHTCDAVAKDILAEHTKRKNPTKEGMALAYAVKRAGGAIWQMMEKINV